jgi:hypothetical protein
VFPLKGWWGGHQHYATLHCDSAPCSAFSRFLWLLKTYAAMHQAGPLLSEQIKSLPCSKALSGFLKPKHTCIAHCGPCFSMCPLLSLTPTLYRLSYRFWQSSHATKDPSSGQPAFTIRCSSCVSLQLQGFCQLNNCQPVSCLVFPELVFVLPPQPQHLWAGTIFFTSQWLRCPPTSVWHQAGPQRMFVE